jgi:YHS domain-containing protein
MKEDVEMKVTRGVAGGIRAFLVAVVLVGTGSPLPAQSAKPVNVKCPVTPEKRSISDITLTYKGKIIAFCSEECRDTFDASPEEYVAKIPELKGWVPIMPVNEFCPVLTAHPDGMKADPGFIINISGKMVGFCSASCRNKFTRSPDSYLANLPEITGRKPADPKKEAEKAAKPPATGPCDLKRLVKGPYCAECKRDLMPDDLRQGKCKRCETKADLVEYCVKWVPAPPPAEGEEARPGGLVEDRARVTYQCPSCSAQADRLAEIKHAADCKGLLGAAKKICSKSGTAPHATDK